MPNPAHLPAQRLTVPEVAAASRRHLVTVRRDLESGALHGTQKTKGGRWLVRTECLDAFLDGAPCEHQTPSGTSRGHLSVVAQ